MKIKYEFATGEEVEIEVSEEISEISIQIDKKIHNSDRRETRRHNSYGDDNDKQKTLVDQSINLEATAEWNANKQNLNNAISQLKPIQQELVQMIFYQGLSETEVASAKGISQQAISKQLKIIYKNIKNLLN